MLLIAALLIPLAACGGGSVEENKLVVWHDKEDAVIDPDFVCYLYSCCDYYQPPDY